MKKFLRKNKKYIGLILIAVIAFNFAFLPLIALAAKNDSNSVDTVIGFISGKALLFASSAISAILGAFFGVILTLEAKIIDYIINPNNFSLVNTPVVTLGWGITRDLANMFFILILLVIAFATVLKIQSYGIKQLLWKVVVAAILINFSLVIAGFIIDFAQILTGFFLKGITGDGFGTITTRLASGMQILNFYNPANPKSIEQGIAQFGASSVAAVVGIILTLVGLVITVFVFGATVIFLIVRIIYIWGLLIFAPIVWVLWIIPETKQYFSQWWNEFIKWVFFAPIYVFMIYLSLSIFDAQGSLNPKAFWAFPAAWKDPAPGLTTVGMPSAIFQWILVIAMMFGSLIVAQKFGLKAATAISASTQRALTGTKNWAGRYARRKGAEWTRPMTEEEKKAAPPKGVRAKIGAAWRKTGAALGGAAVAIPGARGIYLKQLGEEQKAYATDYGKYKDLSKPTLEAINTGLIINPREKLAFKQARIEKDIDKPKANEVMTLLQQAQRYGQEEKFLDLITGKDFFNPDYGYNVPEINNVLNRSKQYGKEEKIIGTVFEKVIGRGPGKIAPKADELEGFLKRAENNKGLTRKIFDTTVKELGAKTLDDKHGFDQNALINLIKRANEKEIGKADDLLKIFPHLSGNITDLETGKSKTIEGIIGKIKTTEASKISKSALENKEVQLAMAKKFIGEHIMNAAKEDRLDVIDNVQEGIDKLGGIDKLAQQENNPRLAKWIKKSPGNTFFKKFGESEKETTEEPGITVVGKYAKVPPPEERKG